MKCDVTAMIHLSSMLSFLAGAVAGVEPYAEYSEARMPQYGSRNEESDPAPRIEEYGDRSPDAPPHFDYKYEESHGKSDDELIKDIDDEKTWSKPFKKKRKHNLPYNSHNVDLLKNSDDETEPEYKPNKKFKHRPKYLNRNFEEAIESRIHAKHKSIDLSDDTDNVENKSDYINKENSERDDSFDDLENIRYFGYRSTIPRKARRKPRDRSLPQLETGRNDKYIKLENREMQARSERDYFERNRPRRLGGIIDREGISLTNNKNDEYEDYHDMKRVQSIESRLPVLMRRPTVRTMEAESTGNQEPWPERRTGLPNNSDILKPSTINTTLSVSITTTRKTTTTTETTSESKSTGNTSELSLAERSRLSILKKAQRKESFKNASSTKPPVLLHATRGMHTVVMVEPKPDAAVVMRAKEVSEDSPARLQRARRLMRRKLVAGARSITDLTDDWDQMVCDYIDVALLDSDAASSLQLDHMAIAFFFLPYCYSYLHKVTKSM